MAGVDVNGESLSSCFSEAGIRYDIHPVLLEAIAIKESALSPLAVNENKNSIDIGLMQINSFWFPKVADYGISKEDLLDPCTSIFVGAWVLAQNIQIYGQTWEAVGAYNAGTGNSNETKEIRKNYANSVYSIYERLIAGLQ